MREIPYELCDVFTDRALAGNALAVFPDADDIDWKCRVFAPGEGIGEDPATGAAAGPLAVHLARHGRIAFGDEIVIEQGVEIGRPSTLHARARGSRARLDSVEVGGHAVLVGRGTFTLPDVTEGARPGGASGVIWGSVVDGSQGELIGQKIGA